MSHETGAPTPASSDADRAPERLDATDHADDAAGADPEEWARGWRISRHLTVWTILVPLVAIFAGALFSASSGAAQGTDLRSAAGGLPDLIREETRRGEIRAREVARLNTEVEELTQRRLSGDQEVSIIVDQANALAQTSGTVPVEGPGVVVSLTDSPLRGDQIPSQLRYDDLVVHQQDVQAVVNALWRGGAEAMMIQDQRVISTSAVRCVGNTLILQGRVYSPPFVITAIGPPNDLISELDNDQAIQYYRQLVDVAGLGYAVELKDTIEAPAYSGSILLQHARPLRPEPPAEGDPQNNG